eukprot:10107303-Alexandrium_andersonii.AAC.1
MSARDWRKRPTRTGGPFVMSQRMNPRTAARGESGTHMLPLPGRTAHRSRSRSAEFVMCL